MYMHRMYNGYIRYGCSNACIDGIYHIYIYASPPKTYLCLFVMLHYNSFGTIIVPSEYCID